MNKPEVLSNHLKALPKMLPAAEVAICVPRIAFFTRMMSPSWKSSPTITSSTSNGWLPSVIRPMNVICALRVGVITPVEMVRFSNCGVDLKLAPYEATMSLTSVLVMNPLFCCVCATCLSRSSSWAVKSGMAMFKVSD